MKCELMASHGQFSINSPDKNNLNIKRIRVVSTVESIFRLEADQWECRLISISIRQWVRML
jgi:hypothetical protein